MYVAMRAGCFRRMWRTWCIQVNLPRSRRRRPLEERAIPLDPPWPVAFLDEEVRLLDIRHEHVRVRTQVMPQARCAPLLRADDHESGRRSPRSPLQIVIEPEATTGNSRRSNFSSCPMNTRSPTHFHMSGSSLIEPFATIRCRRSAGHRVDRFGAWPGRPADAAGTRLSAWPLALATTGVHCNRAAILARTSSGALSPDGFRGVQYSIPFKALMPAR